MLFMLSIYVILIQNMALRRILHTYILTEFEKKNRYTLSFTGENVSQKWILIEKLYPQVGQTFWTSVEGI